MKGNALFFDTTNKGYFGRDVGYFDRTQEFSFDLWFYVAAKYEDKVPVINHRDDDNVGGVGYRLEIENQRLNYLAHSRPFNMLAAGTTEPLPLKQWVHVDLRRIEPSIGIKTLPERQERAAYDDPRQSLTEGALPVGNGIRSMNLMDWPSGLGFGRSRPSAAGSMRSVFSTER